MEYRLLGSCGCAVSVLALGTLTFGNETDQATSFSQLDRFIGGTLVDSADVYAGRPRREDRRALAGRPAWETWACRAGQGPVPRRRKPGRA
jgi:aryl-alcohol dehydrogenase-like predicted oxidoreductase